MTAVASIQVVRRPFNGYDDPRLPVGLWVSEQAVIGDATGGFRVVQLVFNPASAPRASLFYSLEQIHISDTDNNSKNGAITSQNLDGVIGSQVWRVTIGDGPALATIPFQNLPDFPLFLGGQIVQGTTSSLDFQFANVDGATLNCSAQGYMWSARSRSTPGGPQRPVGGLFRA